MTLTLQPAVADLDAALSGMVLALRLAVATVVFPSKRRTIPATPTTPKARLTYIALFAFT